MKLGELVYLLSFEDMVSKKGCPIYEANNLLLSNAPIIN